MEHAPNSRLRIQWHAPECAGIRYLVYVSNYQNCNKVPKGICRLYFPITCIIGSLSENCYKNCYYMYMLHARKKYFFMEIFNTLSYQIVSKCLNDKLPVEPETWLQRERQNQKRGNSQRTSGKNRDLNNGILFERTLGVQIFWVFLHFPPWGKPDVFYGWP